MATAANITPIKLGVKFKPPAIILIYNDKSKLRKRVIPAKEFDLLTDIRLYVENFKLDVKYRKYFEKIPHLKLEKIFFILQDNMKGYTLKESAERAKKYENNGLNDSNRDDATELTTENIVKETLNQKYGKKGVGNNTYDEDDFQDTESDEEDEEKNPPSVSTISDVKAKHDKYVFNNNNNATSNNENNSTIKSLFSTLTLNTSNLMKEPEPPTVLSKTSALDLLSNQMQSVKTKIYDFEDEVEDEEINEEVEDEDEDNEDNILNFVQTGSSKKKEEEKLETAFKDNDDDSSSSF
jgi:hypothetical protein